MTEYEERIAKVFDESGDGATADTWLLARIAVALEVIASDITERKERERAALVSQYRHLQAEVERTGERFTAADKRAQSVPKDQFRRDIAAAMQSAEAAMIEAQGALDAFLAANPGIEEMAGES